jgi:hypothetical protein
VLKRVPQAILEKLGGAPGIGDYYEGQVRPKLAEVAARYPFKASSDTDVSPTDFDDLFAAQGKLAQLADVAQSPGAAMRRLLDAASRVGDAYGEGKAFAIKVTPEAPALQLEPGVEKERLPLTVASWGITLADTPVQNKTVTRVHARLQADATSKLEPVEFEIAEGEKRLGGLLGRKKVYDKDELKVGELPPPASGPWSFLRFLQTGKPEKKGPGVFRCSWQIPLEEKKTGKKIATLAISYEVASPVIDPGFFRGFEPPAAVGD